MIIAFRNFKRNKTVNLTYKSILYFQPNLKCICVSFFENTKKEYDDLEPLNKNIQNFYIQTKYPNKTNKPQDHIDSTKTSGWANPDNAKFFTEGYNQIFNILQNENDKVLMLAEDHFFTKGIVLQDLLDNDYDLAYAAWDHPSELDANASILCIRPNKLKHLFPVSEEGGQIIEHRICNSLIIKINPSRLYKMKYRKRINYFNDGMYTNSSEEIKSELKKVNII